MNGVKNRFRYETPFTIVDSAVLMNEGLSVYDKAVYCILCSYASNTDKSCYPSYKTIARKARCSRRKVISVISHLEELGLVEKQEQFNTVGDNTSNLYIIKTSADARKTLPGAPHTPPPDACASPPNAENTPPDAESSPELNVKGHTQIDYFHLSIYQPDELDRLKECIDYSYFKESFPDKILFIDSLLGYIMELRQEDKPELRSLLLSINDLTILEFLEKMKGQNMSGVKNIKAYIKKVFVEFLREREVYSAII
ncbi:MAG: helix-turn-helix domain-containing protein [Clostridiaceae bacterium]|nr:helix-turn-helix domain-containing protein [Clostridiaceae bacterium]